MPHTRKADTIRMVEYLDSFRKRLRKLRISDDDLDALTHKLKTNPGSGKMVPGTGGAQKLNVHWRGGSRIIYFFHVSDSAIVGITFYLKSEKSDLTPEEKKAIKAIIKARTKA